MSNLESLNYEAEYLKKLKKNENFKQIDNIVKILNNKNSSKNNYIQNRSQISTNNDNSNDNDKDSFLDMNHPSVIY